MGNNFSYETYKQISQKNNQYVCTDVDLCEKSIVMNIMEIVALETNSYTEELDTEELDTDNNDSKQTSTSDKINYLLANTVAKIYQTNMVKQNIKNAPHYSKISEAQFNAAMNIVNEYIDIYKHNYKDEELTPLTGYENRADS
jgi:hypothetical protein